MKVTTYKLELRPDDQVPQFRRLYFDSVEVDLAAVFHNGIHPQSVVLKDLSTGQTHANDAVLSIVNDEQSFPAELKAHGLSHPVTMQTAYAYAYGYGRGRSYENLDPVFQLLGNQLYFVDDITYEQLVAIATERLRRIWCHHVAREMINAIGRDFSGIRTFLKRKNAGLRIVAYESLDDYDLSEIVSVDDFLTEDSLLVSHGISTHNFRRSDVLRRFTDENGCLKLAPAIKACVVRCRYRASGSEPEFKYYCTVSGTRVAWEPDIKAEECQRKCAREVAEQITGVPRYCFSSSLADFERALGDGDKKLRFPDLHYDRKEKPAKATAKVKQEALVCYGEASGLRARLSNDRLKDVLRAFGKKQTGRKEDLVRRIAELLAEEYAAQERELDRFFAANRFVRLSAQPKRLHKFPILEDHTLRSPLIIMYAMRHMRGNVILEAGHLDDSVQLVDLAQAWLERRVNLTGSFVPVV